MYVCRQHTCPAFAHCKLQTYRVDKQKDRTRRRKKEEETTAEKGHGKHKEEEQEKDKIAKNGTWQQKGEGGGKETEQVKRNGHKAKEKGTKRGTGKQTTTNI